MTQTHPGPPPELEQRIRARGAVLDMEFTLSLYGPLLQRQPRTGVEVVRDVAYGEDPRHRLDIYRPDRSAGRPPQPGEGPLRSEGRSRAAGGHSRPVLIFLHGGGFIRGDKVERENVGLYFARQGFVTVVPSYRLAPAHRWPAGGEDVVAAYQWVRHRISESGGNPDRIFLAGESAGAAHVATALLIRRLHPRDGLSVCGAVLVSGVYNVHLERLARRQFGATEPDPRNEAYFGRDFAAYPSMSIVELIDAPPVPLLITFAELDLKQFQVEAGELFARLVTRHGFDCDIEVIRGHNHLTQAFSFNTGDESLSGPMLRFFNQREM